MPTRLVTLTQAQRDSDSCMSPNAACLSAEIVGDGLFCELATMEPLNDVLRSASRIDSVAACGVLLVSLRCASTTCDIPRCAHSAAAMPAARLLRWPSRLAMRRLRLTGYGPFLSMAES